MLEEIRPAALADHEMVVCHRQMTPPAGAGRGSLAKVQSLAKPFDVYLAPHQIDKAGRCQRERDDRESQHIDHGHSPGVSVALGIIVTALSRPRPVSYFTATSIFFRRCAKAIGARTVLDPQGRGEIIIPCHLLTKH